MIENIFFHFILVQKDPFVTCKHIEKNVVLHNRNIKKYVHICCVYHTSEKGIESFYLYKSFAAYKLE